MQEMLKKAVYPGSFDPITNGHLELIERGARLFSTLLVAIGTSIAKKAMFSQEERVALIKKNIAHLHNVEVLSYNCLLVDFMNQQKAQILVRGLRAVSDFEYEFQFAAMNRKLDENIETIFLTPSEKNSFISSSLVKEIAIISGDVSKFVPQNACLALQNKRKHYGKLN